MVEKDSHCSYCGQAFARDQAWPRHCEGCGETSFLNPTPVAVLLLPVDNGVLTVRRAYGSRKGLLALPGGYIDHGESWQQGAARELYEEANISIEARKVELFRVYSARDTVLIFGLHQETLDSRDLLPFKSNTETTERVIVEGPTELAFPLHTRSYHEYLGVAVPSTDAD